MTTQSIDLFSNEFHQNPYHYYQTIRPHHSFAKVNFFSGGQSSWMAFTYETAEAVLKDDRFIKDMRTVFPNDITNENLPPIAQSMLFADPPNHRRLRSLVQSGFTPKKIESFRERIKEIAEEQAELMSKKDTIEFIEDYAFPIPIRVICELIGVPVEDQEKFQRWSHAIVDIGDAEQYEQVMSEFIQYLDQLIQQKKEFPKNDLLSDLIKAEEQGDRLTTKELNGIIMLMIVAGHETTVNLISNGLLALLTHPSQLELLKKEPSLYKQAVEEILRYNGPVEFSTDRWANEDFLFEGQQVKKGDHVIVSLASAGHDPNVFANADEFQIKREQSPHLAFGKGIHYCLGAPLARLEGEVALQTLFEKFPDVRLATDLKYLQWRESFIIRGLKSFPVWLK
ncbi:cytochrome P450 [Bacillus sp. TS-2]|nr:cytochrome P450 [Bacillus sp. TS-2]